MVHKCARKINFRRQRVFLLSCLLAWCIHWITSPTVPAAWGQANSAAAPRAALDQLNNWLDFQRPASNIDTATVRLDGRRLFLVTALQVSEDAETNASVPVKQRVREIESKLHGFVRNDFDPDTLQVIYQIQNGLPVIYANDQSLLTVTAEDAEIYGVDLQRRAEDLTTLIQEALIRAKQERQPTFLRQQGYLAGPIAGLIAVVSYLISRVQKKIRKKIRSQHQELTTETTADVEPNLPQTPTSKAVNTALRKSSKKTRQRLRAFQKELLQVCQIGLWLAGLLVILGLFPQTRRLQVFLFAGIRVPLQLVGVGLGIYLAIRLSTVLIDRFLSPLEDGEFLSPETAQKLLTPESVQRLTLRISTLSLVLKNIAAILLTIVGFMVALSVVGVPLGPLVAGAGIIGVAISFAAQSVLKDSINGFLIFLEDQYGVGDWITLGELSGSVESMGLRITQLRNAEGALITIPNGDIRAVKNLSKNWSRADIHVPIAYRTNLMKAMQLMDTIAEEMTQEPEWKDIILEPPQLMGADDFGDRGVIVRLWIKTLPLEQWKVAREYRRRLKLAFDQAEIPLPLPQQVLWVESQSISNLSEAPEQQ